jgi:UDP-3-O-[3-hydroxymyristoyl] glucosamine N-acyltransferase
MHGLTVGQLADITGAELRGDADCLIQGIAPLDSAVSGELAFLHTENFRQHLVYTKASVVILTPEAVLEYTGNALVTDNPLLAYAKAATALSTVKPMVAGVHPSAIVDASAEIAPSAAIGANAVLGARVLVAEQVRIGPNVVIGDDCVLGPGTCLEANVSLGCSVSLGADCTVHSGAVLGSDGFGFAPDQGQWVKIPQLGKVRLGDRVEVGANTTIDRGSLGDTVLADGVKLDNQVHIAHNVQIGEHTAIAGCVGIAGSTKIGAHCTIAGACGVVGHIELVDHVHVSGMTAVTRSITTPGQYTSILPAMPHSVWGKNFARIKQLDQIARRLRTLEKALHKYFV